MILDDNSLILVIDDDEKKEVKYKDVKGLIVKLSGSFYFKHSKLVTRIKHDDGTYRYYRKSSPLIVPHPDSVGAFVLKSQCFETEEGTFLYKKSPNVVKIGDKYYKKSYTVLIPSTQKYYLKSDPAIVECYNGEFALREEVELLSQQFYPPNSFGKKGDVLLTPEKEVILKGSSVSLLDPPSGDIIYLHNKDVRTKMPTYNVVYDFIDKTNPQESRLVFKPVLSAFVEQYFIQINFLPGLDSLVYYVHKSRQEYFEAQINEFIMPRKIAEIEKLRQSINAKYSDLEEGENTARIFKKIPEPYPGKHKIFISSKANVPITGKKLKKTGGIPYSFGVEIETTQGLLKNQLIEDLGLSCVGDRSIGAGEYVTPPLVGDAGMEKLLEVCEEINKHCLVDDRCGIHVHVGGLTPETRPNFNKQFHINAIKLGCLLEEELYKTCPKNRQPTLYHCHSIQRWRKISKTNYPSYMGAFIFGPKEWWLPAQEVGNTYVEPFFDFDQWRLSRTRNRHSNMEQWAGGRYKWLNLLHCFHDEGHKTLEFRIYAGTTLAKKVIPYVLFSLAFTYVVDRFPEIIRKGVRLSDVVDKAFEKYPGLAKKLNAFHEMRKAKFAREEIYPPIAGLDFLK